MYCNTSLCFSKHYSNIPSSLPSPPPAPHATNHSVPKARDPPLPWMIEVKSPEDIAAMRASGLVAREVLDAVARQIKVGMTTDEIDMIVHGETVKRGAYPSPLNYHGFPKSCCTSLNEVVCHGIPDVSTVLQDGDIVNVDVTVFYKGYHGDCSETFCVGQVDEAGKKLVKVTYDAWQKAIEFCKPGRPYKDIGAIIEEHVTKEGFTTVREFCGHGLGKVFHTTPNVLHFKNSQPAGVMQPGHTFTIEPMICEGTNKHILWPDKWTATTADGRRSAQFEHTLLITPTGVEALTGRLPTSPKFFWEE